MSVRADTLPFRRQGQGVPLVLVHGFLGGSIQWRRELECFSAEYDVIAFDLPGFGQAGARQGHDRIEDMAGSIIQSVTDLGLENYHLLGHSMGGMIAQTIAYMDAERVRKLVLYGTGPVGVMPNRFEPIEASKARLEREGLDASVRTIVAKWFVKGAEAEAYDELVEIGMHATPQSAGAALDAMAHWSGLERLAQISMPSLILWGEFDQSYRWPQVETLWNGIAGAHLAVVPNCSHATHLENSVIFQQLVLDFLDGSF